MRHDVKDPRLGGIVSVTQVDTSADLKHAKVYVSVMGTEADRVEVDQALQAASGFLRKALGERLTIRYTPELVFYRDESIERGDRLLQLIKEVSDHPSDEEDGP